MRLHYQLKLEPILYNNYLILFQKGWAVYEKKNSPTKKCSFEQFFESVTSGSISGSVYKIVKEKKKVNVICEYILLDDGTYIQNVC